MLTQGLIAWTRILHVTGVVPANDSVVTGITVRYWAAARAAAGVSSEVVEAADLAELVDVIVRRHASADRFAEVIDACSVLIGEVPVGKRDRADVRLSPGTTVEFLPPFAGG